MDVVLKFPPPDFLHIASSGTDFISSVHLKNSRFTSKVSIRELWSQGCASCLNALPYPALRKPQGHMRVARGDFLLQCCCRGSRHWCTVWPRAAPWSGCSAVATFDQIFSQSIYLSIQPCVTVDKPCRLQGLSSPTLLARTVVSRASSG